LAEAGGAMHGVAATRLQVAAQLLGARQAAGNVVADVRDCRRARLRRQQVIESDDAPGFGGRLSGCFPDGLYDQPRRQNLRQHRRLPP
jgi:hypothetical protein